MLKPVDKKVNEGANKSEPKVINPKRAALFESYQRAFLAEKDQRELVNREIGELRRRERALKSSACAIADFDQMTMI